MISRGTSQEAPDHQNLENSIVETEDTPIGLRSISESKRSGDMREAWQTV